jgi:hypothetical protein
MAKRGGPARLSAPKVITSDRYPARSLGSSLMPIASLAGYALWLVVVLVLWRWVTFEGL